MEKLEFYNPVFEKGKLNFTVRLGEKWKNRLSIGDKVELEGSKSPAEVQVIVVCRLKHLEHRHQIILELEHDPRCRSIRGLKTALAIAYPKFDCMSISTKMSTVVTCIGFLLCY